MKVLNFASALLLGSASAASPALSEPRKDISIAAPWEVTSYDTAVYGFAFQRLGVMENLIDADANDCKNMGAYKYLTLRNKLLAGVVALMMIQK